MENIENIENKSIQETILKKNRELIKDKTILKKQIENSIEYKKLQKLLKLAKILEEHLFFEKKQLLEKLQIEKKEQEILILQSKLN